MSRIPSPFQTSTPISKPRNNSPGFLLITRPPSACYNPRGTFQAASPSLGQRFPSYRGGGSSPYGGGGPSPYRRDGPSPSYRESGSPYRGGGASPYRGSPSPSYNGRGQWNQNSRGNWSPRQRGSGGQRGHHFSSQGGQQRTPLKDIDVDKFVSLSMVQDPWQEFQSSDLTKLTNVSTSSFDLNDSAITDVSQRYSNSACDSTESDSELQHLQDSTHASSVSDSTS